MAELDVHAVQTFARKLLDVLTGSALTKLIILGYWTRAVRQHGAAERDRREFRRCAAGSEQCFRIGGGVPYAAFRPQFTNRMDDVWRRIYGEQLVTGFLAAVPGLADRLTAGAQVLDIGCGTGHAVNLMAKAYPRSRFVGYDIAADAIERAGGQGEAPTLTRPQKRYVV